MQTPTTSDIDLLLIGKTGNGKSATGNSILRKKVFKVSASFASMTTKVSWDVSRYKEKIIKVVDGPGLQDTRMSKEEGLELFLNAMEYAIMSNPQGYHAFLLVVRYGQRFTQEDMDTVEQIKQVFGPNFVREYCIVLMTGGDNFAGDAEDSGETFQQWCQSQGGSMQMLMREVAGRIVLFDNLTKDERIQRQQLDELLAVVENLRHRGQRYTNANFQKCAEARDRMRVQARIPIIQDETMCQISLIQQKLIQVQCAFDSESQLGELADLEREAQGVVDSIARQDKGTGALGAIARHAQSILNNVKEATQARQRLEQQQALARQERERITAQMEAMRRQAMQNEATQAEIERLGRQLNEERQLVQRRTREEADRLEGMTNETQASYIDLRARIDLNIFTELVNFTKGILVKGVNKFLSWLGAELFKPRP